MTSSGVENGVLGMSWRMKEGESRSTDVELDVKDDAFLIQQRAENGAAVLASKTMYKQVFSRPGPKLEKSLSAASHAIKGLQFVTKNVESKGWPEIERRFDQLQVDGLLLRTRFGRCIGMEKSEEFAEKIYEVLARRNGIQTAVLTKHQLRLFWEQLSDESFDARLRIFFEMVDKNADGRLTEEEIREIITISASANNLSKIKEHLDECTVLLMEELDPDNLGHIELRNLEMLMLQPSDYETNSTGDNSLLSRILSQKLIRTKDNNIIRRAHRRLSYFFKDNQRQLWTISLWLCICIGLFAWKFMQYRNRAVFHVMGYCVTSAKGAAETIKFNMALILLPVCRKTITWIRSKTRLGMIIPFNDNLYFHKVIAFGIAVGIAIHVICHLTCDFPRLLHISDDEYELMKPFFGENRPPNYWWFVKGTEGWTGVTILILMAVAYTLAILAQPWFRTKKSPRQRVQLVGFNTFWFSHHLFVVVYALYILHGLALYLNRTWYKKTTWMYLAVPGVLYICERFYRILLPGYKNVRMMKVRHYPGGVMAFYMEKPQGFEYKSGQYVYMNCPEITIYEWHPFSITSAPGDNYLSMHIRTKGDWTSQLGKKFSEVCQPADPNQSGLLRADFGTSGKLSKYPKLIIDGPYGAPAQDYSNYDVLLLIGLGIGATPLISIVKDVLNKLEQEKQMAAQGYLESGSGSGAPKKKILMKTDRVFFYWVTREEGSFDWFRGVMNEVAEKDKDGVIELHNYCSSVYAEGDARSALITMLQTLHHAKNGTDIVSGTRVRTHFARPNWRRVFKDIAIKRNGQQVGVFYCGEPSPISELRKLSRDFSHKTRTKFHFHKENF